jgi:uncharacterized spore protein YtfJ
MTTERSNAVDQAHQAAEGSWMDRFLERFVERIVERIGGRAGVQAVYGAPIERGETTVVPVARVRWVFGGGAGSADAAGDAPGSGSGAGGGGGVTVDPIGYLEITPGGTVFQPISPVQPYPSPMFLLASGIAAAIVLRALARLIRR